MQELIKNAANGWMEYIDAGKYAVLFLAVLLWDWYRKVRPERENEQDQKEGVQENRTESAKKLILYASVMAVVVIVPVTAVLLMIYQTKFYDYKWIWSVVPVTAVIAYQGSKLYLDYYRISRQGKWLKPVGVALLGLAILFLCGNLNTEGCQGKQTVKERVTAEKLLDKLAEYGNTEDICLWAPSEILAHVRSLNGEVRLLYGRNMWENALNAYAYDGYEEKTHAIYQWMENWPMSAEAREASIVAIEAALDGGINCIIVPSEDPGEIPEKKQKVMASYVSEVAQKRKLTVLCDTAEGYDIYWLQS